MKYNIWHIDAYDGWSDYDGPTDCNIHEDVIMDAQFSKKEVLNMYMATLSGRSNVIHKCEIIGSGVIETDDKQIERLVKVEDGVKRLIAQKEQEINDYDKNFRKLQDDMFDDAPGYLINEVCVFKNELEEILDTD